MHPVVSMKFALPIGASLAVLIFGIWCVAPTLSPKTDPMPTRVLARDGSLLYASNVSGVEMGEPALLPEMPPALIQAVVAAEDKRYYAHHGVDVLSIGQALIDDVRAGRVVRGSSTIEAQLVKNLYFSGARRTILQKMREMTAASWWSVTHSKEATLERYLNTVYLGGQEFGMPAAARDYFHKDLRDLSLPEAAMLAGIIGSPARYEPVGHAKEAHARQAYVLDRMQAAGWLSKAEVEEAAASRVSVFIPKHLMHAPHFVFRVLDQLQEKIPDIRTGGYEVTTTLDPALQGIAERSVERQLQKLAGSHVTDAAVTAMVPKTGEVLAYVGSADYWDEPSAGAIDMAATKRQPGSALKPFMYQAALMEELVTPATVIADLPARFESGTQGSPDTAEFVPRNYGLTYDGPVSVREALGSSLNIPAVKTLSRLGLNEFFGHLKRFGLAFEHPPAYYGLGIVLGGGEVTLEDATRAYATLANGNAFAPLVMVRSVKDRSGKTVFTAPLYEPKPIFEERDGLRGRQATYLLTDILSDQTARSRSFGEESLLNLPGVAAKTGTTKDYRDNWAFGYSSDLALGVWTGNADDSPMYGVSGISGAVPIWRDIFSSRHRGAHPPLPTAPPGLVERDVCATSGLLATPICPKIRHEKFIAGTEPTAPDTWYRQIAVDPRTGLLASAGCPRSITKTFLVVPPDYLAWAESARIEAPPVFDCDGRVNALATEAAPTILSPLDGDSFDPDARIDAASQDIPFIAGSACAVGCVWTLDGRDIKAPAPIFLWKPVPGEHVLELAGAVRQVHFNVR